MPTTHTFIDLKDKTLANPILPWYKTQLEELLDVLTKLEELLDVFIYI
jgi:hypothetical protein